MKIKAQKIIELASKSFEISQALDTSSMDEGEEFALAFWRKFLNNHKVMAMLILSDDFDEAHCIYRLSLEHLFNMFASIRKKGFIGELKNNTELNIPKALKSIKSNSSSEDNILTEENEKKLNDYLSLNDGITLDNLGYSIYITRHKHQK